ncbi:hypothetical protein PENARI_c001G10002 [Penicillium arizonense]|uniref:Uncharacterized protein n=1 Tax=Penicillium arizonense TaxID=1835702 RepID=A0A1F5LXZ6_PENAI|nr:hypothetical protein PENARI_c001G10002 [Penicillium arizonense]OGE58037.1 hypothetical protein PENARI_c001G10002 [Penicillium arizonense]
MVLRFLPWTIDFKATPCADQRDDSVSHAAFDGPAPIVGRLSCMNLNPTDTPDNPPLTSEAVRDDLIFKGYASGQSDDDWKDPHLQSFGYSERHEVHWGRSQRYNQPRSTATGLPGSPVVKFSSPLVQEPIYLALDGLHDASHLGDQENTWASGSSDDGWIDPSQRHQFRSGRSQRFNQPRTTATRAPGSSTASTLRPQAPCFEPQDGSLDASALEEPENAWGLLSTAEWTTRASEQGNGGLHNAIRVGIREGAIGNQMWVGTLGMPIDSQSQLVFVDDNTFEGHYTQFCRSVLWPVLHYQMQEGPRHAEYEEFSWDQYVKVNEAFADVIIREWKKGDTIWVFDYHLLLLPEILRSRLPRPDIGFFLTTPFPSYEVFRCLFSREKLLNGMLGADLVSFQAEEYQNHFIQCCCRLLGLETVKSALQVKQRLVRVWYESLQIDSVFLQRVRQTSDVKAWMTAIGNKYKGKRLIAARDRLDAPGGVKHKLLAYERFLKRYPKWRHTVVLIQVISAAPEIPELGAEVSKIATRINARYSTVAHQPLVLLQEDINYSQFIALLSVADIFLSTTLREGLNLTCHEYFKCQGQPHSGTSYGSMIVSEFAETGAIDISYQCNPWDYKSCAKMINEVLEAPLRRRRLKWHLQKKELESMEHGWLDWLQSRLSLAWKARYPPKNDASAPILRAVAHLYNSSNTHVFFLEDGALFGEGPGHMSLEALGTLSALAASPSNIVYITSRRSRVDMQHVIAALPSNIGFILECGSLIREVSSTKFHFWKTEQSQAWLDGIWNMTKHCRQRVEGSFIEQRDNSMVFRYDMALDYPAAIRFANDLAYQARAFRGRESYRSSTETLLYTPSPI